MQQLASMSVSTEERLYHVLAVDDSIIDRKLIEGLLKTSSYQVTTVDSGSKALEFLGIQQDGHTSQPSVFVSPQHHQHEVEVNLIITDFSMPGMTGYDLLKRVKESSAFKDIPVVIMSSENVPSRMSRCLEEGAEEFFLKPVQLSDLKRLKPHILKGKLKEQQQPIQASNSISTITTATISSNTNSSSNNNSSSNKRKALDEVLSPERTWPRLTSSLAVV